MATIDISKIVSDKLAAMDAGGIIQAKIEENIEKTVLSAIEGAFNSYELRRTISDRLKEQLPDIVQGIGFDGYSRFLADTIQQLVISGLKNDAKKVLTESVTDIFCKRHEFYRLSDLIREWKAYVDPDDEDERKERNEQHDGYTCRMVERTSASGYFEHFDLFLDELGDHGSSEGKTSFEFVVELSRYTRSFKSVDNGNSRIDHIYLYGSDIVNNIREVSRPFQALLANLYINRTPIVMDVENIDKDDHYYQTDEE